MTIITLSDWNSEIIVQDAAQRLKHSKRSNKFSYERNFIGMFDSLKKSILNRNIKIDFARIDPKNRKKLLFLIKLSHYWHVILYNMSK